MRRTRFAAMAMLCICFAGCSLIKSAERTLFVEPWAFPTNKDSHRTQRRDRQWAETAWKAEMAANPELCCSEEYKRGFNDGFADYLYAGGTGEPPPVPPRRLWNLDYRTAEGRKAVEDWFAGFRRGAQAVRAAGYRNLVTVKSSLVTGNNLDATVMPSDVLEDLKPVEVIPTPFPTEPVPQPEKPAPPDSVIEPPTEEPAPQSTEPVSQLRATMPPPATTPKSSGYSGILRRPVPPESPPPATTPFSVHREQQPDLGNDAPDSTPRIGKMSDRTSHGF